MKQLIHRVFFAVVATMERNPLRVEESGIVICSRGAVYASYLAGYASYLARIYELSPADMRIVSAR